MKIAIDLNGVIRDIFLKSEQVYTKYFLEEGSNEINSYYDSEKEEWVSKLNGDDFEYGLNLPVTSMNLIEHFKFKNNEDLYDFFYIDFPMQIFGHSPSISGNTFNILNDLYVDLRDENELTIISDEIGKSKPATLFFLSKYGCLIENINFYSKVTIEKIYDSFDIIVTSNPDLLLLDSIDKKIIKVKTTYNSEFKSEYEINDISELQTVLNTINKI
jgi:hypothetical protein